LTSFCATLPQSVRQTISRLDLTYYFPCSVARRTVAYLGVGRTRKAISSPARIWNCHHHRRLCEHRHRECTLYRSLQTKVAEYERLKEFSENIVESINVGIVAVGFEDRVESWNTQMEALTGVRRADAVGRKLNDLLPSRLAATLEHMRGKAASTTSTKVELGSPHPSEDGIGNGNGAAAKSALVNIAVALSSPKKESGSAGSSFSTT
jgi:PAS domain-containing protein